MTARKKASIDLCTKVFQILQRKAKEAEGEINLLCECAEIGGEIAQGDYFKVTFLGMVRHHFKDEKGKFHNHLNDGENDGNFITDQWPKQTR